MGVITISCFNFLPRARTLGDGRRQHIVFHRHDVCTPLPLPLIFLIDLPEEMIGGFYRCLLSAFLPCNFGSPLVRRKQKLVSEGTAIQTERSFLVSRFG